MQAFFANPHLLAHRIPSLAAHHANRALWRSYTKAATSVEPIHSRMPVLLDLAGAKQWLDTATELNDLYPLFENRLPYELLARPVQQGINNSRNKTAALPIECSQVSVLG
ncbi:MAG: SOS response-associated peptidase family protein [Candidatus Reddybacter sp.]